jgi:hypothetical protein
LTLSELLFRANESVIDYEQRFSNAVAEENYTQRIIRADGSIAGERQLRSDILLILLPGADSWLGFRDVFEVNGRPVRDRDLRLQALFLDEVRLAVDQALEISQESARYNIGQVKRTVNLPTIALSFLHPLNQHRFAFEKIGELSVDNRQTWAIRYHERVQPTVVQTQSGDLFAHGTLWLDIQNGKALRTHLVLGDAMSDVRTTIKVNYWHNEDIGTLVPAVMDELYENPKDASATRIEATAVYSNFRKFDVSTDISVIEKREPW